MKWAFKSFGFDELGKIRKLKLVELGVVSFRILKLGELGEVSLGFLDFDKLGEVSLRNLKLGHLVEMSLAIMNYEVGWVRWSVLRYFGKLKILPRIEFVLKRIRNCISIKLDKARPHTKLTLEDE